MVILDTSVFVEVLRGAKHPEVEILIVSGAAILSSTVCLELLAGVRKAEEKTLLNFLDALGTPLKWPSLETCRKLVRSSRLKGMTIGIPDLMIIADALEQRCKILTFDRALARLAEAVGIPLVRED